jgi:3-hydroxyisobutyrate dehydrogenase-like beta-hydroxyacid dehydrogenase
MKVSFIGLGIMGKRMAANLLKHGVELIVWNRSEGPVKELEAKGAQSASTAEKAVFEADIIFSMLSTPEVVKELFFGPEGCLVSMKKNALWVDCSTVNPSFSLAAANEAKNYGIRFMDAPVAGTKPQAESAGLVFFVGADKKLLSETESLLNYMGSKILHIGETGKGASFKMLVNMLLAESMLIFSETLILGEQMGINRNFLLDILPDMPVTAPFTKAKAEMIRNDDFEVQFPLEWMHKDLRLASETADELKQPIRIAALAKEIFNDARQSGLQRYDFSAVYKYLKEQT